MLSVRSKVAVAVAIVVLLASLLGYAMEKGSFLDQGDWVAEAILAGIFFAIAVISVVVDVVRDRSLS